MRDKTIDLLKGMAIVLMVMGHFLASSVSHLDDLNIHHNGWLVGQWIYSFHMPLFFFITGYLSVRAPETWRELGRKLLRKAQTLLLPGISFMLIGYWLYGKWSMPWFVRALFLLTFVFLCIRFISNHFKLSIFLEIMIHATAFIVWFVSSHYLEGTWIATHLGLHGTAARYPYLVLGYLFAVLNGKQHFLKTNWLLTMSIVLYVGTYYLFNFVVGGIVASYVRTYIVAPTAIFAIFTLVEYIPTNNRIYNMFTYLGGKTLAIYLLSGFFLVSFPKLADWWIQQNSVTSVVVQIVTSLCASAVCIALCLGVEWVISKSKILNFILFGKK